MKIDIGFKEAFWLDQIGVLLPSIIIIIIIIIIIVIIMLFVLITIVFDMNMLKHEPARTSEFSVIFICFKCFAFRNCKECLHRRFHFWFLCKKNAIHHVKSARRILSFFGSYFPAFRLNTEIYSVNLWIQSEFEKIWKILFTQCLPQSLH